jgi:DNA-binding response OmpR family regulator
MATMGNNKKNKDTLLVIEDEPALADIYSTKLKLAGYEVLCAYDGVEGLEKALHDRPALILLDLIMPLKDGFEVLHDLKQEESTRDIPVIIMSNLGQDFEVKRGLALGAAQFLIKTAIDTSELVARVKEVLGR